jgi:hypothetical protein
VRPRKSIIALATLCGLSSAAWGSEDANQIYAAAVAAINGKDCAKALPLLRRYKELKAADLASAPGFRAQLDDQIAQCALVLANAEKEDKKVHIKAGH